MARIVDVHARRVWDSRGRATVEAEVILKGARGRAIAPSGASTGSGEAKSIDAREAVSKVNTAIRAALLGVDARDQAAVRFFPEGASTGGRIVIKRGEAAWRVDVAWLTGEVTLGRGEGEP